MDPGRTPSSGLREAKARCLWTNVGALGPANAGKSTLFGYLLLQLGEFEDRYVRRIDKLCAQHRKQDMRLAYLLEPYGVTRTTRPGFPKAGSTELSHVGFELAGRRFMVVDAPGHPNYMHWAIVGISQANVGVLVAELPSISQLAATRPSGLSTGSIDAHSLLRVFESHVATAKFFGIRHLIVVVSKMDLAEDPEQDFKAAVETLQAALRRIHGPHDTALGRPFAVTYVPTEISVPADPPRAKNVTDEDEKYSWWSRPEHHSLMSALASTPVETPQYGPLRFAVEQVHTQVAGTEIVLAGKVISGSIRVGDNVLLLPTNETARVSSLTMRDERRPLQRGHRWGERRTAAAGELVGVALRPEGLTKRAFRDITTGAKSRLMLTSPNAAPPPSARVRARLMVQTDDLLHGSSSYKLTAYVGGMHAAAEIANVHELNGRNIDQRVPELQQGDVADVTIRLLHALSVDDVETCIDNARIALVQGNVIVAGGVIIERGEDA